MATTEASDAQSQAIADEVTSALGHLAKTAEADLEAGEDGGGASATDTLITTVAKSMISKVDSETSISLLRRGATYCWGKVRGSLTKENVVATFGRNGSLRRVCLEAANCRKFSRPDGAGDWRVRVFSNFSHFKTLYLAFTVFLTAWSLFSNLWIMIGVMLLVVSWYYFTPLARLLCKMESPSVVQKFTIMIPVSIVVALITGIISKIIELAVISILIAVTHASFHQGVDELPEMADAASDEVPMAVLASDTDTDATKFSGDIEQGAVVSPPAGTGDETSDAISDFEDDDDDDDGN
eukprot:INCI4353.1.p1 GENE.INCI4353.1~~INCI4353.1.p1  ORF type:complete len:296 (-),score=62.53 INCI4353.1:178-1065(-)